MSEKFSVMPMAGGLLDQDKLFMYILQQTLVWFDQRAELDRAKQNAQAQQIQR